MVKSSFEVQSREQIASDTIGNIFETLTKLHGEGTTIVLAEQILVTVADDAARSSVEMLLHVWLDYQVEC